jgi:hypothetical protein
MTLYMCTRFNYAHREMETEGFEALTDEAACVTARKIAREHQWLAFELHDRARLVVCPPVAEAAL